MLTYQKSEFKEAFEGCNLQMLDHEYIGNRVILVQTPLLIHYRA